MPRNKSGRVGGRERETGAGLVLQAAAVRCPGTGKLLSVCSGHSMPWAPHAQGTGPGVRVLGCSAGVDGGGLASKASTTGGWTEGQLGFTGLNMMPLRTDFVSWVKCADSLSGGFLICT